MMATLATQGTILAVQKYALANVRLHIAFSGLGRFSSAVAERAIGISNIYQTSTRTDGTFLNIGLSHLFYVESTII